MVSSSDFDTVVVVLVFCTIGLIVSMIVKTLYDRGIVFDELITGSITLVDVQAFVIVGFLVIGVIIAAVKK